MMRSLLAALFILIGATVACSGPAGSSSSTSSGAPDAAATADAGIPRDAGQYFDGGDNDAGFNWCDQDGDGFLRDAPECDRRGLPADCADDDALEAPAVVVCRNTRQEGCGFYQPLAQAVEVPEIGGTATLVVSERASGTDGFTSLVTSRAWGTFARGITASTGSGATVTILPFDDHAAPVNFWLDDESNARVGLGRMPDSRTPLLALARRNGEVQLLDVTTGVARQVLLGESTPGGAAAVAVAGRTKPALVVVSGTVPGNRVTFTDDDGAREFLFPHEGIVPWLVAAGDVAVMAASSRVLHIVSRTSDTAQDITLDADLAGRGAIVSRELGYLLVVLTSAGLRAVHLPSCEFNSECASAAVLSHVTEQTIVNGGYVAMTLIEHTVDLVAIAVSASDQPDPPPNLVELLFVHGAAPQTVLGRTVALGPGSFDGRTFDRTLALAIDNADGVYGGSFLMVNAVVRTGQHEEEWSTGYIMCAIE